MIDQTAMKGWAELKRVLQNRALHGRKMLIGLDFDGTLSPIVRRPHQARLSGRMRGLLQRLMQKPYFRIAIVSGRRLRDVQVRIDLRGVHYVGNHGFEIQGPGLRWSHPEAKAALGDMQAFSRLLRSELKGISGILLENKKLTLSVHYRQTRKADQSKLHKLLLRTLKPYAGRLVLAPGKKIWEIWPKVQWNKGYALLKIARFLGDRRRLIFVGDDRTDEDGFRVLSRRALTVRVGPAEKSAARFFLKEQKQVQEFLELLCKTP